jgi:hypothetical protein
MRDQVSYSYKTTGKIIYAFTFKFLREETGRQKVLNTVAASIP